MKKKRNVIYQKSVSLLAAAAMTAVLMTGQVYPVLTYVQNITSEIEKSTIIPENITIEEPVELSEVALPKSDYGVLSWVDDSYVPQKRVQSCEVVFKPAADVDLSYLSGWDAKKKVVKGKITVVVSSIEETEEEEPAEDDSSVSGLPASDETKNSENTESDGLTSDAVENPANTEDTDTAKEDTPGAFTEDSTEEAPSQDGEEPSITQIPSLTPSEDSSDSEKKQESESSSDLSFGQEEEKDTSLPTAGDILSPSDEETSSQEETEDTAQSGTFADVITSAKENSDSEISDTEKTGAEATDITEVSDAAQEDTSDIVVEPGKLNEAFGSAMPGATVLDGDSESENGTAKPDETKDQEPADEPETTDNTDKNIFDNPQDFMVSSARPDTVEEGLTAEEQALAAAVNHNCEGIQVSGVDLPWYVQFQVTSGEEYEFKNEDKATIFQSFEFKLWDLKNNTEYEIPDGQYISVTIPVKEGYEYSIEHLLDNGATETIIPSVNGSTMVFSTHSFSPFGIAGFRPIVGDEIANGAYGDNGTPTPTPTVTISGTPTPSPSVTGTSGTNGSTGTSGNGTTGGQTGGTTGNNGTSGNGTNGTTNTGTGDAAPADGNPSNTVNNGTGGTTSDGTGSTSGTGASQNGTSGNNTGSGTVSDGSGSTGNTAGNNAHGQNTAGNKNQSQTPGAVQTGDNTMILPFVVLVMAAALVIAAALLIRQKKNA